MADPEAADARTDGADVEPLLEFRAVMRRLDAEDPWRAEQTHRSLARYLLEEAHETLEAIDLGAGDGDWTPLRDELGDLLLQVFLHSVIAERDGEFTLDDVARAASAKMRHRNPHVFDPAAASDPDRPRTAAEVDAAYQAIKQRDRPRRSAVDGLPATLPALLYAAKAVERGLPPSRRAVSDADVGERLLALVAEAVADGVDPEQALRDAVRRHVRTADPGPA